MAQLTAYNVKTCKYQCLSRIMTMIINRNMHVYIYIHIDVVIYIVYTYDVQSRAHTAA
jgi:hypothetical protein